MNPPIKEIEQYFLREKRGPSPPESVRDCANDPEMSQTFRTTLQVEMAYGMCKISSVSLSSIPSWSAFHCLLNRQKKFDKSAMHYLPVIEHPPTELSTVKEILNRSSDLCDRLKLDCMVLVFDQAIYSKVQQIRWTDDDLFGRFVVRLGDFHTTMSFLSVIGKRFVDSGLKDVFIESRIVTEGSLTGVMNGHQYNQSIQAHKITLDALMRLRFEAFLDTLNDYDETAALKVIGDMYYSFPSSDFIILTNGSEFSGLLTTYNDFISRMRRTLPTFDHWSTYIDMVQTLLLFIQATRESNWELHLAALRKMLPWYFAYDRPNYARYGTVYYVEMCALPYTHPTVITPPRFRANGPCNAWAVSSHR